MARQGHVEQVRALDAARQFHRVFNGGEVVFITAHDEGGAMDLAHGIIGMAGSACVQPALDQCLCKTVKVGLGVQRLVGVIHLGKFLAPALTRHLR